MGVVHRKEGAHLVVAGARILRAGVAGGHGEQVLHCQALQLRGGLRRHQVREEILDVVADLQQALLHGEAHRSAREGLGGGVHGVRVLGAVGAPPVLGHDLVVPENHQAVDFVAARVERADEVGDGFGADALRLGGAALQAVVVGLGVQRKAQQRGQAAGQDTVMHSLFQCFFDSKVDFLKHFDKKLLC